MQQEHQPFYTASHALVVGINAYHDPRFVSLGKAEDDAEAVAEVLSHASYGFQVSVLLGQKATRQGILGEMYRLRRTNPDDRIVVYFAGHGYTLTDRLGNETGYLAAADTVPDQDFTALEIEEITGLVRHSPAKHIAFIFDACFSGQALGLTRAPAVAAEKFLQRRAYQVLSAGAGDQTVSDFRSMTGLMVEALQSNRAEEGGLITLSTLGLYLQQTIAADSNQLQIPQFGHLRGSQGGDFVLRQRGMRVPTELEEGLYSSRERMRLGAVLDLIELARSGEGQLAEIARQRLQSVAAEHTDERIRGIAQRFLDGESVHDELDVQAALTPQPGTMQKKPAATYTPPPERTQPMQRPILPSSLPVVPISIFAGIAVLLVIIAVVALILNGPTGSDGAPTNPAVQGTPTDASAGGTTGGEPTGEPGVPTTDMVLAVEYNDSGTSMIGVWSASSGLIKLLPGSYPAWSPDGTQIAYACEFICIMNSDGSNVQTLVRTQQSQLVIPPKFLAWSPDGQSLVYSANDGTDFEIYLYDLATSSEVQLTSNDASDEQPAWIDNESIAFVSDRNYPNTIWEMWFMTRSGVTQQVVLPDYSVAAPDFANGTFLFVVESRIYGLAHGTSNVIDVFTGESNILVTYARWSEDGTRVIFSGFQNEEPDIYQINADGTGLVNLTQSADVDELYAVEQPRP